MFSREDLNFIESRGSQKENVDKQISFFQSGFPPLPLVAPAIEGSGLNMIDKDRQKELVNKFDSSAGHLKVVKFVPASGAASRMFKVLFGFMESYDGSEEQYQKMLDDQSSKSVYYFFKHLENFAFYESLKAVHKKRTGEALEESHVKRSYVRILQSLLSDEGLGYGQLPKGLLEFHKYEGATRTPVEEHMVEGAHYAKDASGKVRLHFTVSPEHREKFVGHIESVLSTYEEEFVVTYEISFSEQKASTDTIAVDLTNEPFRNEDGSLLFRPAGHGALIENLNDLDGDIAFIKNIDNVVPDHLKSETFTFKKVLAGILLTYQEKVFEYLRQLEEPVSQENLDEMAAFLENELSTKVDFGGCSSDEKRELIKTKLDRPIRACGMVKAEGDPGGGPFWAKNADGSESLQIVETAQIDLADKGQQEVFGKATHFNPADLVCGLKNYKGEKFDLLQYRDPMTGFITQKSKDGKDLKAQELPGLWNGAMSDWNSIFVEVPLITFNPVKAVNDLLKKEHQ